MIGAAVHSLLKYLFMFTAGASTETGAPARRLASIFIYENMIGAAVHSLLKYLFMLKKA